MPYRNLGKTGLLLLCLLDLGSACHRFHRSSHFGAWHDADHDGQDTRVEVLVEESLVPVTFADSLRRKVIAGKWHCPYKGADYTDPGDLDIDHVVPLKEAYESGAWSWDRERRRRYANYLARKNHLLAVDKGENRRKADQDPADWLPPNARYHRQYVREWCDIKARWGLSADPAEAARIRQVLGTRAARVWLRNVKVEPEQACGG